MPHARPPQQHEAYSLSVPPQPQEAITTQASPKANQLFNISSISFRTMQVPVFDELYINGRVLLKKKQYAAIADLNIAPCPSLLLSYNDFSKNTRPISPSIPSMPIPRSEYLLARGT